MLDRTVGYVESTIVAGSGEIIPSPARGAGMQVGDEIIAVDGRVVNDFSGIQPMIPLGNARDVLGTPKAMAKIVGSNECFDIELQPMLVCRDGSCDEFREIRILPRQELIVRDVQDEDSSIKIGDQILQANNKTILHVRSLREIASNRRVVRLEVLRDGMSVIARAYTKPIIVEKPSAVLRFGDITVAVIPFHPNGVNKNQISKNTDSKLKLFSTQCKNLRKCELFSRAEIAKINGIDCYNLYDVARLLNQQHDNLLTIFKPGAKKKSDAESRG
jgi:hypothetical protein